LKTSSRRTSREDLRRACQITVLSVQDMFNFYLPFLDGLTMIVQGKAPFDRSHLEPFRVELEPVLGRAAYALRAGDELIAAYEEPLLPPEDPRVPAAMLRAIMESIIAALGAQSVRDLKNTPLISRKRLQDYLEEPLLGLWLDRNDPGR
jgi:hypothetical protein